MLPVYDELELAILPPDELEALIDKLYKTWVEHTAHYDADYAHQVRQSFLIASKYCGHNQLTLFNVSPGNTPVGQCKACRKRVHIDPKTRRA